MRNWNSKILMVLLFTPGLAFAAPSGGIHFGLSAAKFDNSRKGDLFGDEIKDNRTLFDVKLGYLSNSLYLGAIYSSFAQNTSSDSPSRTAYGVTAGYHGNNGFYLDVSYYLNAEYKVSSSATLKQGTGIGAEFGYNVMVSSNVYLGLELAYRTFTYKKLASTLEIDSENTVTDLVPLLNIGFYF